ncbi:MAG: BrxA/BrxB family bacilliredoxin [Candidatus Omnitrophica bacterium]|nr:BrxA/BrxB family bacilliredoxin [Candidatus Omnitrophota bacterium]
MQPYYDPVAVKPMEEELERVGVHPLKTAAEVDEVFEIQEGATLLVINSVCGCAAGGARPGVMKALQNSIIPDRSVTVFAGVDHEAVQRARYYLRDVPPSSPFIALFKEGKPVFVLERHHIEQLSADSAAERLCQAFNEHCSAKGPSISPEKFAKITAIEQCGSSIPLFGQ